MREDRKEGRGEFSKGSKPKEPTGLRGGKERRPLTPTPPGPRIPPPPPAGLWWDSPQARGVELGRIPAPESEL